MSKLPIADSAKEYSLYPSVWAPTTARVTPP